MGTKNCWCIFSVIVNSDWRRMKQSCRATIMQFAVLLHVSLLYVTHAGVTQQLSEHYSKDNNHVYMQKKILPNADPLTFEIITPFAGKDKARVFLGQQMIEGADPKTFVFFGSEMNLWGVPMQPYAKDKSHVYFMGRLLQDARPKAFRILEDGYSADSIHVWKESRRVPGAGPKTFEILGAFYTRDGKNVYFHNKPLDKVDVASFEVLSDARYTRDKNQVWLYRQRIENAEATSFEVLQNDYAKDQLHVFQGRKILSGAHSDTFRVIDRYFTADNDAVYYKGNPVAHADPYTFIVLERNYSKDEQHVFNKTEIIPDADPLTFKVLPWCVKDGKHVFYYNNTMQGCDPGSVQLIGHGFIRDKSHVYRRGKKVIEANPDTFRPFGSHKKDPNNDYFTDGERVYCLSELIDRCDIATFEHIRGGYAKDKNNMYFRGKTFEHQNRIAPHDKKFKSVDRETFEVLHGYEARDRNYVYRSGQIAIGEDPAKLK